MRYIFIALCLIVCFGCISCGSTRFDPNAPASLDKTS